VRCDSKQMAIIAVDLREVVLGGAGEVNGVGRPYEYIVTHGIEVDHRLSLSEEIDSVQSPEIAGNPANPRTSLRVANDTRAWASE